MSISQWSLGFDHRSVALSDWWYIMQINTVRDLFLKVSCFFWSVISTSFWIEGTSMPKMHSQLLDVTCIYTHTIHGTGIFTYIQLNH